MKIKYLAHVSTAVIATAGIAHSAKAQDTSGDIVVTAQHRQQSVQDVPIAITALSGDQLQKAGVDQPVDLARLTPGLSTANSTSGGTPIFAIRGIGLDDFNPNNNSGVATYIDGVGISSPEILSGQLFDVDRVEVLKGPQGTLYGRNATGGAINFFSREPTSTPSGYANVDFGRFDTLEYNGALSGPITDTLNGRFAATYKRAFEGYQTDIDTGRKFGKPDRLGLRGSLKYGSGSNFTALLNVHFSRDRSIEPSPISQGNEALLGPAAAGLIDTDTSNGRKVRVGDLDPRRHDNGIGTALTLTYRFPTVTLSSISGYDHYLYRSVDNNDGIAGPTFDFFQHDIVNQFYQELRLASTKGLFGGFTDWSAGASFSHDRLHGLDSSDQSSSFIGQFFVPPDFTTPGLSVAQANYIQTRDSVGVYANAENHLTSRLSLILGVRYSHDRISFNGLSTETGSDAGGVLFNGVGAVVDNIDEVHTSQNVSYRAGLDYKIGRTLLLYGTVSSAYKMGAYYASPALDPASWGYVPPEKITAYEVGAKSRMFDGLLQLNGSIFYYDYRDRQSQLLFVSPTSGFLVASLGTIPKSRVFGQEVEASLHPMHGLQITANLSHLDSKILRTAVDVRGAPLYTPVLVGSDLSQAPHWSYSVGARYEQPVSEKWNASLQIDYSRQGKQASVLGDPNGVYGPLKNLTSRIGLARGDTGLSFAIWGRNLTNAHAASYSFTSFYGGRTLYVQEPLSYGMEIGYSF